MCPDFGREQALRAKLSGHMLFCKCSLYSDMVSTRLLFPFELVFFFFLRQIVSLGTQLRLT